jgi:hypothetical protein
VDLTKTPTSICSGANGNNANTPGLFQIMWVNPSMVSTLHKGLALSMGWAIPNKNFFNVDFVSLMAQKSPQGSLHTTISLMGDPANKPAVWPDPTPKFQTRQFP